MSGYGSMTGDLAHLGRSASERIGAVAEHDASVEALGGP